MNDAVGQILIMLINLPSDLSAKVVETILQADEKKYSFVIHPHAITRREVSQRKISFNSKRLNINLYHHFTLERHLLKFKKAVRNRKCKAGVVIDCSCSFRIEANLTACCHAGVPSILYSINDDKEVMKRIAEDSGGCAVIVSSTDPPEDILNAINFLLENIRPGVLYSVEDVHRG